MSTAGKHAVVGLFYAGVLANKGYLTSVLNVARQKNGGFGKYSFRAADEFTGHADTGLDAVLLEGTILGSTADRIAAAYKAIGKEVKVLSGSFEDEFKKYEEEAGATGGVSADPPANATDNVTASRGSPQAHVETDGRNTPKPWQGTTGTSLDRFGLPLATSDKTGTSAAETQNGLDAQSQQVTARTAASAASDGERAEDLADKSQENLEADAKAREKAAQEEADAKQAAADAANQGGDEDAAKKAKGDTGKASGDTGGTGNTGKAS